MDWKPKRRLVRPGSDRRLRSGRLPPHPSQKAGQTNPPELSETAGQRRTSRQAWAVQDWAAPCLERVPVADHLQGLRLSLPLRWDAWAMAGWNLPQMLAW